MVDPHPSSPEPDLPETYWPCLLRGLKADCPRCGNVGLFRNWLKPVDECPHCAQDWSVQQADDFPAYIGIFIVGHLLAPVMIAMIGTLGMSAWTTLAILLPFAVIMLLAMLQPVKGGVIATLWWLGVGAFRKERPARGAKPEDQ